ncbi:RNA-guided endonuclease InsQ/TnpB family protein [Streptomyces sp. NBC_01264]|uniref:RNA-guided endonuclease InsQ/TnpB family protein n=1 Tax=Streptomyces sp. NBC_01264 TaxID=2903804 RepID=UPI00224FD4B5|nr:transposase [Streptomyces sp. NBC_01264]MCX4778730.1 RNA-guided endonuclease TnpB family protein [Streptomyces sp. NBC_01264]
MAAIAEGGEAGHARYTYRLRVSSTARTALLSEGDRCRWVWNQCVATSRAAHRAEEKCGPAGLDRMLTGYQRMMARRKPRLGQAASKGYRKVKHQAAKAHKKIVRQRQDTARKWAKRVVTDFDQLAVEDFRPKFLARSNMARKAADAAISATKRELINMARKRGRDLRLVHPAHTTTDCGRCGARTKHALPLSERTYTCTACGAVSPRDKNSARVMLVRAGLIPATADRVRPGGPPARQAA